MTHTVLIATADPAARAFIAGQLDADGHSVYEADSRAATTTRLAVHAIDVVLLGALDAPAAPALLLRDLRAGRLDPRVHPAQPVVTLGAVDELSTLRAYDAGSDHHLNADTSYLVLRAVINTVIRRTIEEITRRHLQAGQIHIDLAARSVDVDGELIHFSRKEFDLLAGLAAEPTRIFSKHELLRELWGRNSPPGATRTVDSHACRVRNRLRNHGVQAIQNVHGQGYRLTPLR